MQLIRQLLTRLGTLAAHPAAFAIVTIYAVGWFVFDRESLDWHGIATLATWCMTILIQRAEHRDTQALHAKLDELLHADQGARNSLTQIDEQEPEQIEEIRKRERQED
jgi:low affinity Fe/Cu permease